MDLAGWPLEKVLAAKRESADGTISVVLPARDEQETVGAIVAAIRRELMENAPLVDDLLVVDSGSADDTARIAAAAGARVLRREEILPGYDRVLPGKGEVLWRSLYATSSEFVCFVDADLRHFDPAIIPVLLGPLLTDPGVQLVKAAYDRPLAGDAIDKGGRVTELVARPLLNLHWPELAGIVQPLAGEYAARRTLLESVPFPCGYGVEFAILVDTLRLHGREAIAQVDLGTRHHTHQSDQALGRMSAEILHAAARRLGLVDARDSVALTQFERDGASFQSRIHEMQVTERPPMRSLLSSGEVATC